MLDRLEEWSQPARQYKNSQITVYVRKEVAPFQDRQTTYYGLGGYLDRNLKIFIENLCRKECLKSKFMREKVFLLRSNMRLIKS